MLSAEFPAVQSGPTENRPELSFRARRGSSEGRGAVHHSLPFAFPLVFESRGMRNSMATRLPLVPDARVSSRRAGSTGPLFWKERDRVRCVPCPESSHTSPQPSPSRRGGLSCFTPARWGHGGVA
jgi:hypothetical protein